ncbi:MAG: AmpG family muropeptide MFS transporter [Xanthomonadales bacterium]|nr:AmpG family muropeptide MFS transporter [Gammaproteobacteria bacterium]MBT8054239.1 AmpG family muropeptide MFS transporter [Gammaproteobacteria bacterium]NND57568.1 AmpG family muropeptide MFS transporter [Xanthomonadales bacterium]NNK51292.1 AmpG family muropeptide MFS transporter [Xanthomonadales bacterium]
MLTCVFLGFTSGMPLWVLISLVPAWLRTEGIDLATIGLFSLMTIPYTWKFIWSPLMDRYKPPFLGRRRGWALITQIVLLITIGMLGLFNPTESLFPILATVFTISFFSASQDIVIDAYRRELLDDDELGTGTSIHINAYRLSALVPGSLALILADHFAWSTVFWVTAVFMTIGIVMTLVIREVSDDTLAPHTLREAVVEPFREFFSRDGLGPAMAVLAFILLYKLGDNMAVALATPFYIDMGFSLTEIGTIAKFSALWASIAGSVIAGIAMLKLSINRALWIFGFVQILTILGFVWLSTVGHSPTGLFLVVSGEYLGVGMGTVALTAYLARETSRAFTATQFALFSSIVVIPRTFANASTGFLIEWMGYTSFFLVCTAVAIPGMLMLLKVAPWNRE